MTRWFEGNIVMFPSHHRGFVAASIFIIKDGNIDRGIYLITAIE